MARPTLMLDAEGPQVVDGRHVRAMAFDPVRKALIGDVLGRRGLSGGTALVVGGRYSPLTRIFRDHGFAVTGVDPSADATRIARETIAGVQFESAPADALGLPRQQFDVVYCADTVEVVKDLSAVLAELAAVLRPGGVLILDTVTDTFVARLVYLFAFQRFPLTRIMPAGRYARANLRSPQSLRDGCAAVGLTVDLVVGFEPASVGSLVKAVVGRRAGRLRDDELAGAADFRLSDPDHAPVVTYFAVATKADPTPPV